MHYLLFIGAFLFFAFIAPIKATLVTCVMLLLVTGVVRAVARGVAGVDTTWGEAARGLGLSFVFLIVAMFTVYSLSKGTGMTVFAGLSGWLVLLGFFSAYVLGFKISLGVGTMASSAVALSAAVTSIAVLFLGKSII